MTCGSRLPCGARSVDLLPLQRGTRLPLRFTTPHSAPARPSFRAVHRSVAFPPLQRGSRPPRPRSTRSRAARMVRDFPLRSGAACVSVRLTFRRASHSAPARLTASVWFTVRRLASAPARLAASVWFRGPMASLRSGEAHGLVWFTTSRSASARLAPPCGLRSGGLPTPLRCGHGFRVVHGPSTCFRSSAARGFRAVHGSGRLLSAPARLVRVTVGLPLRSGAAAASVRFTVRRLASAPARLAASV
jgi:hypothetical protein